MAGSPAEAPVHGMIQTIREGFAGRSARKEFWVRLVLINLATAILGFVLLTLGLPAVLLGPVAMGFWLYIAARRFHDLGLTGWLGLAPYIGGLIIVLAAPRIPIPTEVAVPIVDFGPMALFIVFVLWLGVMPGQRHTNRFGPPPGQEGPAEVF